MRACGLISTRCTLIFSFHTGSYRCLNETEFRECAALLLPPALSRNKVAAKGKNSKMFCRKFSVARNVAIACIAIVSMSCRAAADEEEDITADYPDLASVVKAFNPKTNTDLNQGDGTWLEYAYPKGGRSLITHVHKNRLILEQVDIRFLELRSGKIVSSDYFTQKLNGYPKIGSIIAYPRSDFEVEKEFTYIAKDKSGHKAAQNGKLVSVKIILGYPAGAPRLPTEMVCAKTVENLAKNGMPIPDTVGKAGKIRPLVEAAKLRYGASTAKPFCAANPEGKVQILLTGCDDGKARENVLPATY